MVDDPTARFAALVARPDTSLPLDEALFLVAAHARPDLDVREQQGRLDELAAQVEEPSVDALVDLLFARLGFEGDRATYHAPENSLLPAVLDRRRGIPLSLGVVVIEVGRRCRVEIEGVGMPGHYLVRPRGDEATFVDAYDGGRRLDRDACRQLFERLHGGVAWDDRFLRPDAPWSQVVRTLQNLAVAYRRTGDREALTWTLGLRALLPAFADRDRRELGVLLGASGRYLEAAAVLESSGVDADVEAARRMRARLN